MTNYKIAIVGGGPSGMIAAIKSARELGPKSVCIIEKNDSLGKKLLLTGGGRCNICNMTNIHEQLNYYNKKDKNFIKHALYTFPQEELLKLFEEKGLEFHCEDKKRVFPDSEKSEDVLNILKEYLRDLEVDIYFNSPIDENSIEHELNEKLEPVFEIKNSNLSITSSKIIIATGGISYQNTGSVGDGYRIAKRMNHSITNIKPGLVSFKVDDFLLTSLSGITLENVTVSFKDKKKKINSAGNILISHSGLTGPAIIDLSNKLMEKSNYNLLSGNKELYTDKINIDFCSDLTEEEIKAKITKDTPNNGTTKIKNYMKRFLTSNFIDYFLMRLQISSNKTIANLTKKDKNKIAENLKRFPIEISDIDVNSSKITIGGINSKEINSKTLESKYVEGLYFTGEILEPAGPTGGYNLEIAFSTGYLAGQEASKSLNKK